MINNSYFIQADKIVFYLRDRFLNTVEKIIKFYRRV
jgi:hypothetical protein